jgi:uncharacterized protein (DUF305 family)
MKVHPMGPVAGVLAGLTLAFAALATGAAPAAADAPAPRPSTARFEARFMEGMIDHHGMAVEMGEVCLGRAVHAELRALCEQMIAAQSAEITQMQAWLADWYGVRHEPEMTPGDMRMIERLASMSGAEFEIDFMKMLIRHHWKAVVRASSCVDRAFHGALTSLCTNIIETQVAEIRELRGWLCEWYGVCNYGPKGRIRRQ